MEQSQHQPLYAAKDRVPFNLTLVLALGIALWGLAGLLGILPPPGNPEMIIVLGVAVTAYTWLFTPKEYMVYNDAVCVAYGKPRVKTIHFSNIASVEMGSLATIDQLRIRPIRGRRQSIRVRDPETFYDQLESALNAYRASHPEEDVSFQLTGRHPPAVVENEPVEMAEADADRETVTAPVEEEPAEGGGEDQDSLVGQPAGEVTESTEEGEPAAETAPEDPEKPQEPGSRSFY
jgi:hypothetical protein